MINKKTHNYNLQKFLKLGNIVEFKTEKLLTRKQKNIDMGFAFILLNGCKGSAISWASPSGYHHVMDWWNWYNFKTTCLWRYWGYREKSTNVYDVGLNSSFKHERVCHITIRRHERVQRNVRIRIDAWPKKSDPKSGPNRVWVSDH